MKIVHGLSLVSEDGIDVHIEREPLNWDKVAFEIHGANFDADFILPRRQCRELRDWLNAVLDD